MREILFRGKDIEGNWHYGVPLVFTEDYVCITAPHTYNKKVEANTMGQYTGLCDKNGKKIFEGDIVKVITTNGNTKRISKIGIGICTETQSDIMSMGVYCILENKPFVYPCNEEYKHLVEVIGNIHDNPELLKGGAE